MISTNSVSQRTRDLLKWEVANIQSFLDGFDTPLNGERRRVQLGPTGEYLVIQNLPLPDGYQPDYVDVLLLLDKYPAVPPIGLYILNKANAALMAQLETKFNAFRNNAHHDAEGIMGYTWICYHYGSNSWKFKGDSPARGDNIRKFIGSFFAELNK
ncbi:hypothetical protein [Methylobacter sp.]|uniref:hypothetical protein n=1 Tax=Methylobacter sp. TaxID=2051955 RepID=UPI002FDEF51F